MENYLFGAALSGQTVWFLASVGFGAASMLLYSFVRSFTRNLPKVSFAVLVGDIIFFILFTLLQFVFLFIIPQNDLRWFHVLGQMIGGIIFWLLIAPMVFDIIKKLLNLIKNLYVKAKCFSPEINKIIQSKKRKTGQRKKSINL